MRKGQVPYAVSAALVVVVSIAVLAAALAAGGLLEERTVAEPSPSGSRTSTARGVARSRPSTC